jgi:hypothetical protein
MDHHGLSCFSLLQRLSYKLNKCSADTPPPKPRELFTQISNVASLNVKLLAMMTLLNPEVTLPPRKKVYFVSKEKNTSWKKEMFFCSNSMSSLRNPCNFYSI